MLVTVVPIAFAEHVSPAGEFCRLREQLAEALPLHRIGRGDPGYIEQRGGQIDRAHQSPVVHRPSRNATRPGKDERRAGPPVVQRALLSGKWGTVVAQKDHQRFLPELPPFQLCHHLANGIVHVGSGVVVVHQISPGCRSVRQIWSQHPPSRLMPVSYALGMIGTMRLMKRYPEEKWPGGRGIKEGGEGCGSLGRVPL